MKSIILLKQHPCTQLAHLYEHLYLRQVNDHFYSRGLFKCLDYAAHGSTFDKGGVVAVEIDLYTDNAIEIKEQLHNLPVDFGTDNKNITTELTRISAEELYTLHITNKTDIVTQLNHLSATPWTPIDQLSSIDTHGSRQQASPIRLTDTKRPQPVTLSMSIYLDTDFINKNRELAPLFNTISRILTLTLHYKLGAHFGFYDKKLDMDTKPHRTTSTLMISKSIADSVQTEQIAAYARDVVRYISSDDTIGRIVHSIHNMDYQNDIAGTLSFERVFNQTNILLGLQGWHKITSKKNIQQILAHTKITFTYRHQKATLQLAQ